MLRSDIKNLFIAIREISSKPNDYKARFTYALVKNNNIIKTEIEAIAAYEAKCLGEYDKELSAGADNVELNKKYSEQLKEYNNFMSETVEVQLYKVSINDIPDVPISIMASLEIIIKE